MTEKSVAQCSVDGCLKIIYCKGMCKSHYTQALHKEKPKNPTVCLVDGCEKSSHYRERGKGGYCDIHYSRLHRNGTFGTLRDTCIGSLEERFWSRVNKNGSTRPHMSTPCWEWTGCLTKQGYGAIQGDGQKWTAHRLSWFLEHQSQAELLILHECDNKKCVNPNHLREGTHWDNKQDEINRNVHRWGEKNGSKLSEQDVRQIRQYLSEGMGCTDIAKLYDVGMSNISAIKTGRSWKLLI